MMAVIRFFGKTNDDIIVLAKLAWKHNCAIGVVHDMVEISGNDCNLEQFDKERKGD